MAAALAAGWRFGLLVGVASATSGAALLALAGAHVAVLLLGAGAAAGALLAVLGPVRVVLRYAERLVTHGATFRALADLRVWFFTRPGGALRRRAGHAAVGGPRGPAGGGRGGAGRPVPAHHRCRW